MIHPSLLSMFDRLEVGVEVSHVLQMHPSTKKPVGRLRPDSILVELTKEEYITMAMLGTFRMLYADSHQVKANHGAERTVKNDLQGILGEAAVMKALGRNISELISIENDVPFSEKPRGDIDGIEVRATTGLISKVSARYGPSFASRLIYREGDSTTKAYVLVLGIGRVYEIAGWMPGKEMQREEWSGQGAEGRKKAWFVPTDALRPIRELLAVNHAISDPKLQQFIGPPKPAAPVDMALEMLARPTDVRELWAMAKIAFGGNGR